MIGPTAGRTLPSRARPDARAADDVPSARRGDIRTLVRGGALNTVGIVANALLSFGFGVVIARALGADGAGAFFVTLAAFAILQSVAQMGADTGAMRTIARYLALERRRDVRTVVRVGLLPALLLGSALAVVLYWMAPTLAETIVPDRPDEATTYLRILAPVLPIAAGSAILLGATRGLGVMLPYVVIDRTGRSGLRLALALLVAALGLGGAAFLVAWIVPVAIGFVAAAVWLLALVSRAERAAPFEAHAAASGAVAREFWSFSVYRGVAALFRVGLLWAGLLLVGALGSAAEAGAYSAATRIVTAGAFALEAVLVVMGPQISALLALDQRERTGLVFQTATAWLTALSFPFYITVALFAPLALQIFGEDFTMATTALVILSLAMLLDMATGPVTTVLLMAGRSSWFLLNVIATLAVNVVANILLIPPFGVTGAAVAWAVSIVVQNALPLAQVWLSLGLHPFSRSLAVAALGPALCYGALGLVMVLLLEPTAPVLVAFLAVATLLYAAFGVRFRDPLKLADLLGSFRRSE
jgi:O-antigen/teichoic acid export membrane protein